MCGGVDDVLSKWSLGGRPSFQSKPDRWSALYNLVTHTHHDRNFLFFIFFILKEKRVPRARSAGRFSENGRMDLIKSYITTSLHLSYSCHPLYFNRPFVSAIESYICCDKTGSRHRFRSFYVPLPIADARGRPSYNIMKQIERKERKDLYFNQNRFIPFVILFYFFMYSGIFLLYSQH